MDRMDRQEYELYELLRKKLEMRCEQLCHIYVEQYYDLEKDDRDVFITGIEAGKSGRIMVQYTYGDVEEKLYLPPEYIWRTDEEVRVLMDIDRKEKEKNMEEQREKRRAERSQ